MGSGLLPSCLLPLLVLFPALAGSQSTFTPSRATFYGSPDCLGNPSGACGFGEFGRNMNGGDVGAVAWLYRNGSGCGACYQIRCTHRPQLCRDDGVNIVVTDHGYGDNTDFILSPRGYSRLARPGMAGELVAAGVVDVEYRRIACRYPGYNLMVKVKEHSNYPHYLALVFIYQAGQKDILAVELWQEDCQQWRGMRRAYGGVWDMASPPRGCPLTLRFLAAGDDDGEQSDWVQLSNVIPADWKAGVAYDTAILL